MAITRPYSRRNWPAFNRLDRDPARGKSSALASGDAGYAGRTLRFNQELYRPTDTLPGVTPVPSSYVPTQTTRYAGGGVSGDANAIARRYSANTADWMTNTAGIDRNRQAGYGVTPPAQTTTGGYTGDTGAYGPPAPPPAPPQTVPPPPPPPARMPEAAPAENAAQRWSKTKEEWMAQGGSERTFNKANVARGVRPAIDARTSNSNSSASAEVRRGFGWGKDYQLPY